MSTDSGALRIGKFARRVGVSPELLRAWERRYGLLRPIRTEGGFRLYTDDDAQRVERMKRALDEGLSAAKRQHGRRRRNARRTARIDGARRKEARDSVGTSPQDGRRSGAEPPRQPVAPAEQARLLTSTCTARQTSGRRSRLGRLKGEPGLVSSAM